MNSQIHAGKKHPFPCVDKHGIFGPPPLPTRYVVKALGNSDFRRKCSIWIQMVEILTHYPPGDGFGHFWRFFGYLLAVFGLKMGVFKVLPNF